MSWGEAGKGKWVTIYSNPGHVYLVVAGIRFDTSAPATTGSRWQNELRTNERASSRAIRRACEGPSAVGWRPHRVRGATRRYQECSEFLPEENQLPDDPLPHVLPAGPPPEVLDEIDAAWERAQAPVDGVYELHFESHPGRAPRLGRAARGPTALRRCA